MRADKAAELGKNSMVQVTLGTIVCIAIFSWKASDWVHSLTTSVEKVGAAVVEVSEDVTEIKLEVEDISDKTDANTRSIKLATDEAKHRHQEGS